MYKIDYVCDNYLIFCMNFREIQQHVTPVVLGEVRFFATNGASF